MGAGMKLYWRPMWGTDEDIRAAVGNGELLLSEPRLERVLDQAYERGIKAKRVEHERAGELLFGAELRRLIAEWPKPDGPEHGIPVYALNDLLRQFGVPELTEEPKGAA